MKKIFKVFLAILLAGILVFGLIFANAIFGNPISKALATRTAREYLKETYGGRDYEIEEVFYNFKDGYYNARISSPSSKDTYFYLEMNWDGSLHRDHYYEVANGWNTARRLDREYGDLVATLIDRPDFPYPTDIGFGMLEIHSKEYIDDPDADDIPKYALVQEDLVLDRAYDIKDLGGRAGLITLYVEAEDISIEKGAEVLLRVKEEFDRAGIPFKAIDFVLMYPREKIKESILPDEQIGVNGFLYEDIYEEGMVDMLSRAHEDLQAYYRKMDADLDKAKKDY